MYAYLKSLIFSPQREGRRLHKDVITIIETDRQTCSPSHVQRVADLARDEFEHIQKRLAARPRDKVVIHYDLQQQHRSARTRHDSAMLTALTLILIHMRATALGEPGTPALDVIAKFLDNPVPDSCEQEDGTENTQPTDSNNLSA